jgi:GNAT superfamily N-acetyltransferase
MAGICKTITRLIGKPKDRWILLLLGRQQDFEVTQFLTRIFVPSGTAMVVTQRERPGMSPSMAISTQHRLSNTEIEVLTFEDEAPPLRDYLKLRSDAGWHTIEEPRAEEALLRSLFCVTARYDSRIVGCARVVGDGAMYFYIQDLIVSSAFRRRGIGKALMSRVMAFLDGAAPAHCGAHLGMMIAPGLDKFYAQFGFQRLPDDSPALRQWRNGH